MQEYIFGYCIYRWKPEGMKSCRYNEEMACPYEATADQKVCLYCLAGYFVWSSQQIQMIDATIPMSAVAQVTEIRRITDRASKAMRKLIDDIPEVSAIDKTIMASHEKAPVAVA